MALFTQEQNELLCRVGPGTPMGDVFRRYWLPALLSEEIPEPGGPPARVRLLGETLVAFRDIEGRIGLLADQCAHRRASLFFGRNEHGSDGCGLRCIYHGWKYDVDGNVIDTPAEPEGSRLKDSIHQTSYPCREVNGLILTYMGPPEKMPLVPNYEWLTNVERQPAMSKYWNENNWLQSVEGDCDSSHTAYLHRRVGMNTVGDTLELVEGFGKGLTFELESGPWWIKANAVRYVGEDVKYVRTNVFIPPCIGVPPGGYVDDGIEAGGFHAIYQVPADDYTTLRYDLYGGANSEGGGLYSRHDVAGPMYKKIRNKDNDYLIDREAQQTTVFCGVDGGNHLQDAVVTESMGPITDRGGENLGACDVQPIAMRRMMLDIVRRVQDGGDPPGVAFREEDNNFDTLFLVNARLPLNVGTDDPQVIREHAIARGGR